MLKQSNSFLEGDTMYIRALLLILSVLSLLFTATCDLPIDPDWSDHDNGNDSPVSIIDKGHYYQITINYNKGYSRTEIGAAYGQEIKEEIPNFESIFDSYLNDLCTDISSMTGKDKKAVYSYFIQNMNNIITQVPNEYVEEMTGMASTLSANADVLGDGQLSRNELNIAIMLPDVARATQCSAVSVFGSTSNTGHPITSRNLEWYGGAHNQIAQIQAVTKYINGSRSTISIGYVGENGFISGLNKNKIFAAILDAPTNAMPYTSTGKRSYLFDLRYALEQFSTIDEIASFMTSNAHEYAYGHLIILTDKEKSVVIENDLVHKRAVRNFDSELNPGATWGINDAIAAVNTCMLRGNKDDLTGVPSNSKRWESILQLMQEARDDASADGILVNQAEIQRVATWFTGNTPGTQDAGDLYSMETQQIMIFQPQMQSMLVYFHPRNGGLDTKPVFDQVPTTF